MKNADYDEDSLFQTIIKHIKICEECDVTDNDNSMGSILSELYDSDNEMTKYLEEIDSSSDYYNNMMKAYYYSKKYNRSEKLGRNVTINFIDDTDDNMYNNCVIITATF